LVFIPVGHAVEAATVILNLAVTRVREENKRLLVIEANHDRPLIAGRLGIGAQPGLRELLLRSVPTNVALHATAQPLLFALPPGDPDQPVSHEAEARLPGVVEQLRRRFDWLLVNGPEWGSGGSAEWAALGDAAYLVVYRDQWDAPEVEAAHEGIVKTGAKLRGYLTLGR
jgi:Mrp family chromosome partitioning ATPase